MKLESVRILHAGNIHNYYAANQIYHPVDDEPRERGAFAILLEQRHAPDGTFVASLLNTLIREFYRRGDTDALTAFEETLVRLNDQIKQFSYHTGSDESTDLNGVIVLIIDNEIHITSIGAPVAVLRRGDAYIPLVDDPDQTNSLSFTVITSGEIHQDDVLILRSPHSNRTDDNQDLTFALEHTPFYEAGRAYARLLKNQSNQTLPPSEALFIRFNDELEEAYQIYLDQPLESTTEKLEPYKKVFMEKAQSLRGALSATYGTVHKHVPKVTHSLASLPKRAATPKRPVMAISPLAKKAKAPTRTFSTGQDNATSGYQIKTYWQAATPLPASQPVRVNQPRERVHARFSIAAARSSRSPFSLPNNRTIYLIIGIFILLYLVIRIINTLPSFRHTKSGASQVDTAALLAQAENAERDATKAQIQSDTALAIGRFMAELSMLKQIPSTNQNEKSKAMKVHAEESIVGLTKTTKLTPSATPVGLKVPAFKLIATPSGLLSISQDGSIVNTTHMGTVGSIASSGSVIDAVAYSNGQKVAVAHQEADGVKLYSVDAASLAATPLNRSDKKAWPTITALTSFESNLYLLGDSYVKATGKDTTYRVTEYNKGLATNELSQIVNAGGSFYATNKENKIVKITTSGTPVPMAISGVPSEFLPKQFTLLASPKGPILYLYDSELSRILEIGSDGNYHKQFVLPSDMKFTPCTVSDSGFACATRDNKVVTLTAGQ